MKVILLSDLRHQGRRGDVIEVRPGYARNYLMPRGLAMEATPGNLKRFQQDRRKLDARHEAERQRAEDLAGKLANVTITLERRAMENGMLYGSVTPSAIVEALAAQGFSLERRQVDLQGGVRSLGEHRVRLVLHAEVAVELPLIVRAAG